jgi:hypothetical protein
MKRIILVVAILALFCICAVAGLWLSEVTTRDKYTQQHLDAEREWQRFRSRFQYTF